jgi:hypothetical protein
MSNGNDIQPDFVITIGGTDITKVTEHWELQDLEDNLSSCTVTIVNDKNQYSGKFKDGDKVVIRFGYQGNLGPKFTTELKECHENYTTKGCRIIATGLDPAHRLTGSSARGAFYDNPSVKKIMEEIGQMENLKIKWLKDPKDPTLPKGFNFPACNERLTTLLRRSMQLLTPGGKGGKVGKMGSAKKPIKAQPQPKKKGSFYGTLGNGRQTTRAGGMAYAKTDKDDANTVMGNQLQQWVDMASSESICARIELKGIPLLRAKKGLTVMGVGPEHSGKWYVKGVLHQWDVKKGYESIADLLRESLGNDSGSGGGGDQPLVMHGDPYSENTLEVGERDMNAASQLTVTFGIGENVIGFKGGWKVQGSKNAGEGGEIKKTYIDARDEETKKAGEAGAWGQAW